MQNLNVKYILDNFFINLEVARHKSGILKCYSQEI